MGLLEMSFSGAVFIIAVAVVRTALINKIPKKTFLVLWETVFLRLLIPFSIPSMFSIYTLMNQVLSGSPALGTDADTAVSVWSQGQIITAQGMEKLSSDTVSPHSIWFAIWCIGMIFSALFFTVSYLRCRIEFQASLPVCNDYVEQWLKEHSIKRPISVRQSDRILTPLTYGILRPVILMPKGTDWKNTKQLLYVLSHEYVHIRHFDIGRKLAATVVLCIHWFNPMVWIMYILFNRDVELACDESIVRQFGEKSKAVYSLILINMEEKQSGLLPFCSNFSKNAIEERITAIMKMKKVTILSFAAACLTAGGIVAAFATSAQAESAVSTLKGGNEMNIGNISTVLPTMRTGAARANRQSAKKSDAEQNTETVSADTPTFNLRLGGLTSWALTDGSNITAYKADSYTKDTPFLRIVTTDADGKETEQIINAKEVDMTNATAKEMFALDAYLSEEGIADSAFTFGIFTDGSVTDTDTKKNFVDILKEFRDMQYKAGNFSGYAEYNKLLCAYDLWEKNRHQL